MLTTTAPTLNVPRDFGPYFFSVAADLFLYGVLITQTLHYFTHYPNDRTWMKAFVVVVVFADTLNSIFDLHSLYITLIVNFGNLDGLLMTHWGKSRRSPCIASLVQFFFGWRVLVLTKNVFLVSIIGLLSFVQLMGGIGTAIAFVQIPYIPDFIKFRSIVIVWLVSAAICDILITGTLVYHLRRRKTGMKYTDSAINKITALTIETGLLTSIWAMADMICYLVGQSVHLFFQFHLSKLYSVSFLVSLNSRELFTAGELLDGPHSSNHSSSRAQSASVSRVNVFRTSIHPAQQILIDVAAHEMVHVDGCKPGTYLAGPDGPCPEKAVYVHVVTPSPGCAPRGAVRSSDIADW
ncbi:uncharacterized protein BXZ73DRAFT_104441 [Epithele typhae]|uniref:uncharacterized protein n=1 Tax=Epithele typhae TaxID=378194 RepID=UPI002007E189|nr:uncharacterized protein BXZ73DRAFT_104441 [Epithele typhae]KAH9921558.1 hypothetical protein BXZ73DRAFT_104441 [Epithele typhae]